MASTKFKIGSDPEIGLLNLKNNQIKAPMLIRYQTAIGVGFDGHKDIMEVRPGVGDTCPIIHTKNLRICLASLIRRTNFFANTKGKAKIVAGSMVGDDPIGGHIHFNTHINSIDDEHLWGNILDLYLAIPLLMVSHRKTHVKRANTITYGSYPYGRLTNIVRKPYGVEYKTLPSWLISMGFTKSILSLAYTVGYEIHNGKNLEGFDSLSTNYTKHYLSGNRKAFLPLIPKIYSSVRKMSKYITYEREIASLFGLIKAFNRKDQLKDWQEKNCILERWRITSRWAEKRHPIVYDRGIKNIIAPLLKSKWRKSIKIYISKTAKNIIVHPIMPNSSDLWGLNITDSDKDFGNYELMIGIPKHLIERETNKDLLYNRITSILLNSQTYTSDYREKIRPEVNFNQQNR